MTLRQRLLSPPGVTVLLFAFVYLILFVTKPQSQLSLFAHGLFDIALGIVIVANALLLGKLLGGLLAGFRIWGLTSGPLAISWAGRRPSLDLRWKWLPFPGSVTLSPKSREDLERKTIIVLAGGLFALSITTLLAFVLPWLGIVALNNAYTAARFAGLTILSYSVLRGEGRLIYGILRKRPAGRQLILGHVIDVDVLGSLRPREWDLKPVEEILGSTANDPLRIICALVALLRARDAGDFKEAARYFDVAADGLLAMQPAMISWWLDHDSFIALGFADAISFLAAYRIKSAAECRRWLQRLAEAVTDREVVLRAEAGVLLAEGSPALAREVAREAQGRMRKSSQINAGWKAAVDEWLGEIIQFAEHPERAPVAKPDQPAPDKAESRHLNVPSYGQDTRQALSILFRPSLLLLLLVIAFGGWRQLNRHWITIGLLAGFLTIVLVWFIATIRALGRLICGRWAGYTPMYFFVGPVLLSFSPRWRFQFNRIPIRWFGYEVVKPPATADLTKRVLVRLLGGAAGLAVTAIALLVIFLFDSSLHAVSSDPTLPSWLNLTLFFLILALLFCLVVLTGFFDGQSLRILFGGGPRAQALAATDALIALANIGERPRAWREDWVEMATMNVRRFEKQYQAYVLTYYQALDMGDVERAGRALDLAFRTLEGTRRRSRQPGAMPQLHVEAAFFQAHYQGNVEQAAGRLAKGNPNFVPKRSWLRAEAALLHASGDTALAEKTAREALAASRYAQPPGIAILEDEWLAELAEVKQVAPRDNPPPAALRPIKLASGWRS
jgi:hypothetical protein